MASLKAEIVVILRWICLITGVVFGATGVVMLTVQLNSDLRWPLAEAKITSIGVTCDMTGAEWSLSRRPYRPVYHQVACSQVEAIRKASPHISFKVKEVQQIGVRFTTRTAAVVETAGRHNPDPWSVPRVGETVSVRYNPTDPKDIAWPAGAMLMYLAAGAFEAIFLAALAFWWIGRSKGSQALPEQALSGSAPMPRGGTAGFGRRPAQ